MESLGGTCVLACEKDQYARKTYIENFSNKYPQLNTEIMFPKDITLLDIKSIPDFDILCGGFPCQAFSRAGLQKGFEDKRGILFFNVLDILKTKMPSTFLLENVKNLVTHDHGKTFQTIIEELKKIGYHIFYKILNSSDYGVPQMRKRVYIVGFLKNTHFEFPEPQTLTLTMSHIFQGTCNKEIGYTLRCGGRLSPINDRHNWDGYIVDDIERRIGVREAKIMQGFPDDFIFPVSDNQALKQLGNSVTIPVVKQILKQIHLFL